MTPEGWLRRKVGEFSQRLKRVNLEGIDLEPLSITKDRGVIRQSEKYNKRIATDPRKYVFAEDGDFAFDPMSLYYGAIGRVGGVGRGLVSPDYVVFAADNTVDAEFLHCLLRYPEMHKVYESLSETGNSFGKRRRLYWSIFEDIELTLPPLPEQRKIAAILSSVDEAIDKTQAVIDQVEIVKKAMMQDLLTKGLPGRHTRFKQTEIGMVPESWGIVVADDVCVTVVDCKNRTPPYTDSGFPVIRTPNVRNGRLVVERLRHTNAASYAEWTERCVPQPGDVLITREAPVGEVCLVPEGMTPCLGQRMMMFRPKPDTLVAEFMLHAIQGTGIQGWLALASGGSTVGHVRVGDIHRLPVPVPRLDEQRRIAAMLGSVTHRQDQEARVFTRLVEVKAALMSVLLTGEVRVRPDEDAA
jgi:type I restriction enzyme S subunit